MTKLNMTKLSRLLYFCVGGVWVGTGLFWVGTGLVISDGNKNAAASVSSAVGAVMVAATLTVACWFALRLLARMR